MQLKLSFCRQCELRRTIKRRLWHLLEILSIVMLFIMTAYAEEPKVFTDDDLSHYSSKSMAPDTEKRIQDLNAWEKDKAQRSAQEEYQRKAQAELERQKRMEEAALEAEQRKARAEADQADALKESNYLYRSTHRYRY